MSFKLPSIIKTISKELEKKGAKAIVVGGSVRDFYLGFEIKDYDIEVYNLDSLQTLQDILTPYGSLNLVGKSFGVLKFKCDGDEYDFSFPRTESKVGQGHKGFDVKIDGFMSFKEASKRRDFTINAMGYDIQEDKFLDPYGGMSDIKNKLLKHIDDITFQEDPLRVYRAVQFCARIEVKLDAQTTFLCKKMVDADMLETLPKERILAEFEKLFFKASNPSLGFELMKELGVLKHFRELDALSQEVYAETLKNLDSMRKSLDADVKTNLVFMFATLCFKFKDLQECENFILRFSDEKKLLKRVQTLLRCSGEVLDKELSDKDIRILATKIKISELVTFLKAIDTQIYDLEQRAKELGVYTKPLDALIMGKDLVSLGLKPSLEFKKILDGVYELQLSGKISTKKEALEFVGSLKNG